MPIIERKKLAQIKKELKSESTDDITAVLAVVQAIERLLQGELKSRKC